MELGGLLRCDRFLLAIDELDACVDQRQQLRCIQTPEAILRDLEQLPDQRRGGLNALVALARHRQEAHGSKPGLNHVGGPQMPPMLLRELIERDKVLLIGV